MENTDVYGPDSALSDSSATSAELYASASCDVCGCSPANVHDASDEWDGPREPYVLYASAKQRPADTTNAAAKLDATICWG